MTPLRELVGTPGLAAIQVAAFALMAGQIYVCILVIRQRRGAARVLLAALHLLVGFCALNILCLSLYMEARYARFRFVWPAAVQAFWALPWWAAALAQTASLALMLITGAGCARWAAAHITQSAVKETIDLLPAGVCIAEEDGLPLLANLKMDEFCHAVAGAPLTDANAFRRRLEETGEERNGRRLVLCADGRALLFFEEEVRLDGRSYRQLGATDVTEQYRITAELKEKNERLRSIRARIQAISAQASEMVFEQETLNARVAVHDELGQMLLLCRYFFDHPENTDRELLYRMMQKTNTCFLRDAEEADAQEDAWTAALRMAGDIGVRVEIAGKEPGPGRRRDILALAVRECAINAAKHGDADRLRVELSGEDGSLCAELTNNGHAPGGPVRESGGLLSLRCKVEDDGGTMRISCRPEICVRIELRA